jgi:tetratricopeptide (TPR) repeat protein
VLVAAAMVLVFGCGRHVDLEVSRLFQEAQETFDKAETSDEFLRAAGLYQQILDRGVVSGAVLYNQGNALMRAGRRGEAIAAYRRAQRYRPRDPYLEANLQYVLGGGATSPYRRSTLDTLLFWQGWFSYPGIFRLTVLLGAATFGIAVAWLFLRWRTLGWLSVGGITVTLVVAFSAAYDWYLYEGITYGVVTARETVARKGNAPSYEPAFTEPLREGAEFRLVDRRSDWLLIRLPGGQEAWIPRRDAVLY